MPQIPTNLINKEIELLGELVTITVKSNKTYSDWGDESATETETEDVKAIFNVYGKMSVYEPSGDFQEGDMTFFFKSDQSGIVNGTKITRTDSEEYQIEDARTHGVQGNYYVIEALVKKI